MKNRIIYKKYFLLAALIIVISALIFIPFKRAVLFQYQNSEKLLAFIPISNSDTFKIKYTHSINLSDVVESYNITKENQIRQYELSYEDFAVGMPENAAEGETFVQKDGKYYIKNMNRVFPFFDLRTGKVRANHTIIFKEKEYPLSKVIKPGTWIRIKVGRLNGFQLMKGVNIIES